MNCPRRIFQISRGDKITQINTIRETAEIYEKTIQRTLEKNNHDAINVWYIKVERMPEKYSGNVYAAEKLRKSRTRD